MAVASVIHALSCFVVTSLALLRARVNKPMGLRHHRDNELLTLRYHDAWRHPEPGAGVTKRVQLPKYPVFLFRPHNAEYSLFSTGGTLSVLGTQIRQLGESDANTTS
jgi:hypothetical protein